MTILPDQIVRNAYIDLIKRSITNFLYLGKQGDFAKFSSVRRYDAKKGEWLVDAHSRPMTLQSKGQLDLIEKSILDLELRQVPGDYIEAGIWRGGALILMRALLDAYGIEQRKIYAADSFSGIPQNDEFLHDPVDLWTDRWESSLEEVKGNIERFGLLDDRIEFVAGFFADTLHALAGNRFALVRLDSDSHDSVMTSLEYLYPLLSPGGIIIIDDWHLIGCRIAVDAYRAKHGIEDEILVQDGNGYWVKQRDSD